MAIRDTELQTRARTAFGFHATMAPTTELHLDDNRFATIAAMTLRTINKQALVALLNKTKCATKTLHTNALFVPF